MVRETIVQRGLCPCCGNLCFYTVVEGKTGKDFGMTRSALSGAKSGYRRDAIYGEFIFEKPGVVYWHSADEGEEWETIDHAISLLSDDIAYVTYRVEKARAERERAQAEQEAEGNRTEFPEISAHVPARFEIESDQQEIVTPMSTKSRLTDVQQKALQLIQQHGGAAFTYPALTRLGIKTRTIDALIDRGLLVEFQSAGLYIYFVSADLLPPDPEILPRSYNCPTCYGSGSHTFGPCQACQGTGVITDRDPANPPSDDDTQELPRVYEDEDEWEYETIGDNGFQDGDEFDEEIEIDPFEIFEALPPIDVLKAGDRVMFSYMPDRWHEGTIKDTCFSGRVQLVDDNNKTHVFWPEQLRKIGFPGVIYLAGA